MQGHYSKVLLKQCALLGYEKARALDTTVMDFYQAHLKVLKGQSIFHNFVSIV